MKSKQKPKQSAKVRTSRPLPETSRVDPAPATKILRDGKTRSKALLSGERSVAPTVREFEEWHVRRHQIAGKDVVGTVADLGGGEGYGTRIFVEWTDKPILAVDDSLEAIQYAREHYAHDRIDYQNLDLFSVTGQYDTVCIMEVLEHQPDGQAVFKKLEQLAIKRIVLSTPDMEFSDAVNPFHYKHYSPQEIRELFASVGFHVIQEIYGGWSKVYVADRT
jgi:2-polyprenyl-3-methyl-5-hydroxy-6-metoxy-1,4-benzoquinol methylase